MGVRADVIWLIGLAVAPLIGGDGVKPGLGERDVRAAVQYHDSGKPWSSTTSGPAPASAMCIWMPFVWTTRWEISVMVTPPGSDTGRPARRSPGQRARRPGGDLIRPDGLRILALAQQPQRPVRLQHHLGETAGTSCS